LWSLTPNIYIVDIISIFLEFEMWEKIIGGNRYVSLKYGW